MARDRNVRFIETGTKPCFMRPNYIEVEVSIDHAYRGHIYVTRAELKNLRERLGGNG